MRTGGKLLVDQLILHGTNHVFCVPGESYLEILDALFDYPGKCKVFNARHEAGASIMAEVNGKLLGRPGVALVTRGPGACHASVGVHIASQDSTPMILIVGQVSQGVLDREGFQEVDYKSMFGKMAKWVAQIESVDRIPEYIGRAFRIAVSGRPGPVVLSIPENVLTSSSLSNDSAVMPSAKSAPSEEDVKTLNRYLKRSRRPILIIGGSGWDENSKKDLSYFAQNNSVPVVTSFRRQDLADNNESFFVGSLGTSVSSQLINRIYESDLVIVLGARLGEVSSKSYSILRSQKSGQKVIHIYQDYNEIGNVFTPDLGVVSSMSEISKALAKLELSEKSHFWCTSLRKEYEKDTEVPDYNGELNLGVIFDDIRQLLPKDAAITLDAGNHTGWPQRFLKFGTSLRQIGSTCGAMGYAIPAAVSTALTFPDKQVVACVGDGGFMMSSHEISTAVQYGLSLIILIFNNKSYGTIRMHQEKAYPGRVIATDLVNPDFVSLARSLGAFSERINKTSEFAEVFIEALNNKRVSIIELVTETKQISTRTRI